MFLLDFKIKQVKVLQILRRKKMTATELLGASTPNGNVLVIFDTFLS